MSSFDLHRFDAEMQNLAPQYEIWPGSDAFSAAVVNDLCRSAGTVDPLPDRLWESLGLTFPRRPLSRPSSEAAERLSLLAFFLERTCLGAATTAHLAAQRSRGFLIDRLPRFLDAVVPVQPEVKGEHEGGGAFREEFVRRFCVVLGLSIQGETQASSRRRLEELDSVQGKRDAVSGDYERPHRIRQTLSQTWKHEKTLGAWGQGDVDEQD
jgi:hypothetical protein